MEEQEIVNNLKQFSRIAPRGEFRDGLKRMLLSMPGIPEAPVVRRRIFGIEIFPVVPLAAAAAIVLVVAYSGGILKSGQKTSAMAGLNNEAILQELVSSSDITISLNEFSAYKDADQKISVALKEASHYGTER